MEQNKYNNTSNQDVAVPQSSSATSQNTDELQSQPAQGKDTIEKQEALFTSGTSEMPA